MTISVVQKNSIFSMRAWAIWFLGATFMFYKYALEVSPSVMTGTLMKTFNITAVELGHLTACYFYAYLLLQIPAGILLDKFGPRKTTSVAILLCAIGCFIFSRADTFFMAGVGRFLTGAGAAFAAINCLKLINNWFAQRQFAFMAGLMMTMAMSGAVGGQAPLSAFIEKMDWRHAMEIISMSGFGLALLFWFVVRDHSPNMILSYKKSSNISLVDSLKQVLKNTQCWWLSVYSGFAFAPVMVFGGLWGVSFLSQSFKISQHFSAQMVSLIFIGFAVGAPIFGWLSDKLGRRCTVMYWGTLLAFLTISLVIYCPIQSIYILGFLLFVFGFSISSFLLCFTMIREITTPILAATAIGFMNAFDALLGALSDPLTGKFLDMRWDGSVLDGVMLFSVVDYKIAFITIPFFMVLSLFSLRKVNETYCKSIS